MGGGWPRLWCVKRCDLVVAVSPLSLRDIFANAERHWRSTGLIFPSYFFIFIDTYQKYLLKYLILGAEVLIMLDFTPYFIHRIK